MLTNEYTLSESGGNIHWLHRSGAKVQVNWQVNLMRKTKPQALGNGLAFSCGINLKSEIQAQFHKMLDHTLTVAKRGLLS